jgi:hypothetical protein
MAERNTKPPLSWVDIARIALHRPKVVIHRMNLVVANQRFRRQRTSWLSALTGASPDQVQGYVGEVERDKLFLNTVRTQFRRYTRYFPLPTDFMVHSSGSTMFFHAVSVYALVRLIRPQVIVETGGTPGKSSAFILRALQRNGEGKLYTIDLPPPGETGTVSVNDTHVRRPSALGSNWCVPEWLRDRQALVIGPAQEGLPAVLSQVNEVCIFIHDSDHSYEHMRWELETAYPFVRVGGLLWSDDINTNTAWQDFCAAHGLRRQDFQSQGVALKNEALAH